MNSTHYILSRLLLSFGLSFKSKRLQEAAEESHLLKREEAIFGGEIWELAENIEQVGVEYWSLRKLKREVLDLNVAMDEARGILATSQDEQDEVVSQTNMECQALAQQCADYKQEASELIGQRNQLESEAELIKRQFEASRTKIEVVGLEGGNQEVVDRERKKMASLKLEMQRLKAERDTVGEKVSGLDEKIIQIQGALGHDRQRLRDEASSVYKCIARANRDVSKLGLEVASKESEMNEHCGQIGRYVSRHVARDSSCAEIGKKHSGRMAQMQSLRSSIALNYKLANLASGW